MKTDTIMFIIFILVCVVIYGLIVFSIRNIFKNWENYTDKKEKKL